MEEAKDFDYEEEKPLGSRRRRATAIRDIERHTCSRCSKSYIHAWHLKRHTKFECGQEPRVQCPYCAARMKQRGHVYRHIRQCHRGQNVYVIDLNWDRTLLRSIRFANHGQQVPFSATFLLVRTTRNKRDDETIVEYRSSSNASSFCLLVASRREIGSSFAHNVSIRFHATNAIVCTRLIEVA